MLRIEKEVIVAEEEIPRVEKDVIVTEENMLRAEKDVTVTEGLHYKRHMRHLLGGLNISKCLVTLADNRWELSAEGVW